MQANESVGSTSARRKESVFNLPVFHVVERFRSPLTKANFVRMSAPAKRLLSSMMQDEATKWENYVLLHDMDDLAFPNPTLESMIMTGMPDFLRRDLWLSWSGAKALLRKPDTSSSSAAIIDISISDDTEVLDWIGAYESYTNRESEVDPEVIRRIQKDIERSNARVEDEVRLQRILIAYAVRNPAIGYTQSMNLIASFMLNILEEDIVFWLMTSIVEKILPGFYDEGLPGIHVAHKLFMKLLSRQSTQIYGKVLGVEYALMGITSNWLMSLFVDLFPGDAVLRLWDVMFYTREKAPIYLACIAFSLIKTMEKTITACPDIGHISEALLPSEGFQVDAKTFTQDSFRVFQAEWKFLSDYKSTLSLVQREVSKVFHIDTYANNILSDFTASASDSPQLTTQMVQRLVSDYKETMERCRPESAPVYKELDNLDRDHRSTPEEDGPSSRRSSMRREITRVVMIDPVDFESVVNRLISSNELCIPTKAERIFKACDYTR
eukprot:TRINITY_DN5792_c0_g3_i1.p1 TRINITY_DN5792_c0_g3~~TRINITY_DN5792_c0_g3_i1.p1  ORF type:complete len:495 (-),score=97.44 TRINITY_DN5792_c0_g3_i1:112-1596(-)